MAKSRMEAHPAMMAKRRKNWSREAISIPRKDLGACPATGRSVASLPARMLEAAFDMNQTPIRREAR